MLCLSSCLIGVLKSGAHVVLGTSTILSNAMSRRSEMQIDSFSMELGTSLSNGMSNRSDLCRRSGLTPYLQKASLPCLPTFSSVHPILKCWQIPKPFAQTWHCTLKRRHAMPSYSSLFMRNQGVRTLLDALKTA